MVAWEKNRVGSNNSKTGNSFFIGILKVKQDIKKSQESEVNDCSIEVKCRNSGGK